MADTPFVILIVDDTPANLFTLEALLRRLEGCVVVQAQSGEAALRATLEQTIDLVLLDVQMPGMDGYATAQHLKMTARTRDIPIVFVTAVYKNEEFIQRGYAVGAVDYLVKPLDENLLLNRVRLYRSLWEREVALRAALEKLKERSETSFRELFEGSMDAIVLMDLERGFVDCNTRAVQLFGCATKAQLLQAPPGALSPPVQPDGRASVEAARETLRRALAEGRAQCEWVHLRADGTPFTVDVLFSPLDWQGGRVVQGSMRDITERKRLEEALVHYKDHLEEEVQVRTAELVLVRDAAEAANRAKSAFLANMSHELRTPLNAILGFSSLLRKDAHLPPTQHEQVDIISRSGEHLLSLINDILEMSRIEAGRVHLERAPFDVAALVRDVTDQLRGRAQARGLTFTVTRATELPRFLLGDEARMRQVLVNLVGNAVKFTLRGGVTVRFGARPAGAPEVLWLEVEDTGPGITAADQQRLFQPFVQLGKQAADNQGTGLGLALTRQYVQLMGGTLGVVSEPGQGACFRVEVPWAAASAQDVAQTGPVDPGDVVGAAPNQPAFRVLIVEDHRENQLLLSQLMERVGLAVKVAANGEQAITLFQDWQPHLIWMDRRMPVMDGVAATRAIRALPGGQAVKIVAVTASALLEQRDELLQAGMDGVVRKPYRFGELYGCLTAQLGLRYVYAGAPPAPASATPEVLTPARLAVLPGALRVELREALESLDGERIEAALGQVAAYDVGLQQVLSRLSGDYDYPAILKALPRDESVERVE